MFDVDIIWSLFVRYLVFNYVIKDLHKVIQRRLPFPENQIQLIIYSLLRGLKVGDENEHFSVSVMPKLIFLFQFIHSAGVIHRVSDRDEAVLRWFSLIEGYQTDEYWCG